MSTRLARIAHGFLLCGLLASWTSCHSQVVVGSIECVTNTECAPPASICGVDHRCVPGCIAAPQECVGGAVCNGGTGQCEGGILGTACTADPGCDPPEIVCSDALALCTAGCGLTGNCPTGLRCSIDTGRCCAPGEQGCAATQSTASGCDGGTVVSYACASEDTVIEFALCVGPPGPAGCPYCIGGSCLRAGLCVDKDDCDLDSDCDAGLCVPRTNPCPTTVSIASVTGGTLAAGKAVCVRGKVASVRTGYDGGIELKLGTSPYLFVDVLRMYEAVGVVIPTAGDTVTVHGRVRWDASHADWEIMPVDWLSK